MVPFGFSVGDFIAGIHILIDAVHSLSETYGAQADYKELMRELNSLKNGLDGVQSLSLDPTQAAHISAVNITVNDCRACVDSFVQRNSKFKSLGTPPGKRWSLSAFTKAGRGVHWATWKKEEVSSFRAQIQTHSEAIQMLLATLHIKQIDAQGKLQVKNDQRSIDHNIMTETMSTKVTEVSLQQQRVERTLKEQHDVAKWIYHDTQSMVGEQASMARSLAAQSTEIKDQVNVQGEEQGKAFAHQNSATMQINANVQNINAQIEALVALQQSFTGGATPFQQQMLEILLHGATQSQTVIQNQNKIIAQLHDLYTIFRLNQEIPTQVLLSKPVILLDARGRPSPFHLEFIDSTEAFIAVLKVRFKDIGLRKIEKGEFALEDTRLKHKLSLANPWATLVRPGQHISMSMIFRKQETSTMRCPSCGRENEGSSWNEVECANIICRMVYRIVTESPELKGNESQRVEPAVPEASSSSAIASREYQIRVQGGPDDSGEHEMQYYTRVQILTQMILAHPASTSSQSKLETDDPMQDHRAQGTGDAINLDASSSSGTDGPMGDLLHSMARRGIFEQFSAIYKRYPELAKRQETHSRPWRCDEPECKDSCFGWPTEEQRDYHVKWEHSMTVSPRKRRRSFEYENRDQRPRPLVQSSERKRKVKHPNYDDWRRYGYASKYVYDGAYARDNRRLKAEFGSAQTGLEVHKQRTRHLIQRTSQGSC